MSMAGFFAMVSEDEISEHLSDPALLVEKINSLYNSENDLSIYIDKAWHGIHFLLTNSDWGGSRPESLVILEGEDIGDDSEYGFDRLLTVDEVCEVSEYLQKIDYNELKKKFDPQKFEEFDIYPSGNWVKEGDEAYLYLESFLKDLAEFYKKASENNYCVVKLIS